MHLLTILLFECFEYRFKNRLPNGTNLYPLSRQWINAQHVLHRPKLFLHWAMISFLRFLGSIPVPAKLKLTGRWRNTMPKCLRHTQRTNRVLKYRFCCRIFGLFIIIQTATIYSHGSRPIPHLHEPWWRNNDQWSFITIRLFRVAKRKYLRFFIVSRKYSIVFFWNHFSWSIFSRTLW